MAYYNPTPSRVWSRVQNPCRFYNENDIPFPFKTIIDEKMQYKGNILQYKKNSSRLTKNQRYSLIAKGKWTDRTTSRATQSQTYTNPNTRGLTRVNYTEIPFPNEVVGEPNNISGPYQYDINNPNYCTNSKSILVGGSLLCNSYSNPCNDQVIKNTYQEICIPTYCSDVPGEIIELCWNPKLPTFFPKTRTIMNNSTNKWPINYKGLQSALKPYPPILVSSINNNEVTLSWTYNIYSCLPITSFNIYINGNIVDKVPVEVNTYMFPYVLTTTYLIYVTSVSNKIESEPSNILTI